MRKAHTLSITSTMLRLTMALPHRRRVVLLAIPLSCLLLLLLVVMVRLVQVCRRIRWQFPLKLPEKLSLIRRRLPMKTWALIKRLEMKFRNLLSLQAMCILAPPQDPLPALLRTTKVQLPCQQRKSQLPPKVKVQRSRHLQRSHEFKRKPRRPNSMVSSIRR